MKISPYINSINLCTHTSTEENSNNQTACKDAFEFAHEIAGCDAVNCDEALCDNVCDAWCDRVCEQVCDAWCDGVCDAWCDNVCDRICDYACDIAA